jgi:uncharacterized protein YjaG (DUF416 family)
VTVLHFDEANLRAQLGRLPKEHCAAFAAACAERLFPAYVRFSREAESADPKALRVALDALWDDLTGKPSSEPHLRAMADECESLAPDENEESSDEQPYAEDAVAALVYALHARVGQGDRAAWSARCVYEALDHFIQSEDSGVVVTANEPRLLEHPLVQAELARQRRDLDELIAVEGRAASEVSDRLRERARRDADLVFGRGA